MKKLLKVLLVLIFPLGMLYCIGKNLFSGNAASFLGGVLLLAIGFILAVGLLRHDLIDLVIAYCRGVLM